MIRRLAHGGIEALLLNGKPTGTFSYYTSHRFDALSCTLELGKVRCFGENALSDFCSPTLCCAPCCAGNRPLGKTVPYPACALSA